MDQWGQALDHRFQEDGSTLGSAIFHSEGIAGRRLGGGPQEGHTFDFRPRLTH